MAKKEPTKNGKKVRSVDEYLRMLELAGRSPYTIRNYREAFVSYAKFLDVPVDQIHKTLSVDNLMKYAVSITGRAKNGRKVILSILHRFMTLNGIVFDELEFNAVKVSADEDRDDKPLELGTLQKMLDMGNPHSRAILSFMISTGCRAGETCKILLSDVNGDTVTIRNEIAKRRKGGQVYLNQEAREFLDIWLKDRPRYIEKANIMTAKLLSARTGRAKVPRKENDGIQVVRPENDQRLFSCAYTTLNKMFGRLYRAVDGEKGKYRAKITAHACRAYFRTHAVKGMSIDLVEGILRHSGYLNSAYVRMTAEQRRSEFHKGEASLYITRPLHRAESAKLEEIRQENQTEIQNLSIQLQQLQRQLEIIQATSK